MTGGGILIGGGAIGSGASVAVMPSSSSLVGRKARSKRELVRRRETWLVVLGIFLHAIYMLGIFDIYFKTPIVHGSEPVPQRIAAPAKRLVLLIADGLRADKFFEPDSEGNFRAPFLRSIIKERGRWGVSHARPPTESRPGHVAIIAGFYEDPSAVTKGWKANPVEFDSVFKQSRHIFAFGSPDIIPIFCGNLPHSTWNSYPHEYEDFATDASFLDQWSYDQFHNLLNRSSDDAMLKQLLLQDKLVIFLHLLGCDTNGHAHRPYSSIYLNNVNVVDHIAERVYSMVESYFNDNQTAYIFTADHGMSDKGSHGDGHPTNTDTPLVSWGAGIRNPRRVFHSSHTDDDIRFVDEHKHNLRSAPEWDLEGIERVDVNQADIAPLMATLVGLPCPVNSVGSLPLSYLKLTKEEEVEADLANTKQILNQFVRKSQVKKEYSLWFRPFKALENYSFRLSQIEDLLVARDYRAALELSQGLRSLALEGLHYFQTYDWVMLMSIITLGYVGWMINLVIHVMQSYTSLQLDVLPRKSETVTLERRKYKVYFGGCLLMGLFSLLLFLEKSPLLYHSYFIMTTFLWTRILSNTSILKAILRSTFQKKFSSLVTLVLTCVITIVILEFLVSSFSERKLYTWFFLMVGLVGSLFIFISISAKPLLAIFMWAACWFLSVFTLMPAEIPENTVLVTASGAVIILIGISSWWFTVNSHGDKIFSCIVYNDRQSSHKLQLFYVKSFLVLISSVMVWLTTSHRAQKKELLTEHQIFNWSLTGISVLLPLFSPTSLLERLTSIFLGFAPSFLLLSIGYEALFYGALSLVLMGWILVECVILHVTKNRKFPGQKKNMQDIQILGSGERRLQLFDLRIPLIFLVLFNVSFFGTGNFASIASFEISSVYRFVTVFSPFLMTTLLMFKLLIPFMLVICVFSAVTKLVKLPRIGCYFLVILFSDVMTIHFFFLVRNTGSWMEIGNSISHFGIMSAQVVFVLLLFAFSNIYTKDVKVYQVQSSSDKSI